MPAMHSPRSHLPAAGFTRHQVSPASTSLFGYQDRSTPTSQPRRLRRPEPAGPRVHSASDVPQIISGSPPSRRPPVTTSAQNVGERAAGGRPESGRRWHPSFSPNPHRARVNNPNVHSTAGSVLYGAPTDATRRQAMADSASTSAFARLSESAAGKGARWNSGKEHAEISNLNLFGGSLGRGQAIEHKVPGSNVLLPGAILSSPLEVGTARPNTVATPTSTKRIAWAEGDSAGAASNREQHPLAAGSDWEPVQSVPTPPTFLDDFIQRRGKKPLHYEELGSGMGYAESARLSGGGAIVDPTPTLARTPYATVGEAAAPPCGMPSHGKGPSAPVYGGYGERHIFNAGEPGHRGMRLASGEAAAAHTTALAAVSSSVASTVFGQGPGSAQPGTPAEYERVRDGAEGAPSLRDAPLFAGSAGMATDFPAKQQHPDRPRPPSTSRGHMRCADAPAGVALSGGGVHTKWDHDKAPPLDAGISNIRGKQRVSESGKADREPSTQDLIQNAEYADVPKRAWADMRYYSHLADSIATAKVERMFMRKANASPAQPKTPRARISPGDAKPGWRS